MGKHAKHQYRTVVSLCPVAFLRLEKIAEKRGANRTAGLELLIAESAERDGVIVTPEEVEAFKDERRRQQNERRHMRREEELREEELRRQQEEARAMLQPRESPDFDIARSMMDTAFIR